MVEEGRYQRNLRKRIWDAGRPHQRTINVLVNRLRKSGYEKIIPNQTYTNKHDNEQGEIDVLALNGFYNEHKKYALIFEVKSSKRQSAKRRALNQLERNVREVKAFYGKETRCFKFYVYASNNTFRKTSNGKRKNPYLIEWIK